MLTKKETKKLVKKLNKAMKKTGKTCRCVIFNKGE